ncbi:MAG: tRNA (guanosine(37)-N1)-methyltransferase TrmD [Patescibacteria group bacterium]|nr:tRNA (guanosine(37)-N1)-methyltransferase TrmD [Patescibacteria group bacterium]MCL5224237.1 tRNA (guanosine(37)-N1)-methyltransferase TrmD [Patescibacteria group bacterium]
MKQKVIFEIITLFPDVVRPYLEESIIGRAIRNGLIDVRIHDLRRFTHDRHHKVDDRPYGGGPGMVLKPEPLIRAINSLHLGGKSSAKVIMLSAAGKNFSDAVAHRLASKYKRIVLIAGHYEGVDERVSRILKPEVLSVGPYVLTGGELPSLIVVDAVSRKIKDVLGRQESLEEKRYGVGVPTYTRPADLKYNGREYSVPKVLLSGDHKAVERWRLEHKTK